MNRRAWLLASAAISSSIVVASPGYAQDDSEASAAVDQSRSDSVIIVTGSRVARSGFDAPTPTTVLTSEALDQRGLSNVGDFLNEIPSFRPSVTNQTNTQTSNLSGGTYADLRALGNVRTLTLVDGRRHVATAATGQVDMNLIPTVMIDRVDVVTGGASAAYGSDAISGVVNVILKDSLDGFKGDVSVGLAEEGDNFERRASLAWGSEFAGGRGSFIIGGEYVKSDGVDNFFERDWAARGDELVAYANNRPAGTPSRIYATGVRYVNSLVGGVILGVNADTSPGNGVDVLRGIWFPSPNTVGTFTYGDESGGSSINFSSSEGVHTRLGHTLVLPIERHAAVAKLGYDISDSLRFVFNASYSRSGSDYSGPMVRDTATSGPRAILIKRDNAYLPEDVADIMDANGITQFYLGRSNPDWGATRIVNFNSTYRIMGGLEGELGGGWSWDAYAQYGKNTFNSQIRNMRIVQNFNWAYDAIKLPNNQIVCRSEVARAQGCQPLNLFGANAMSDAAVDYVNGTQFQEINISQLVAAANIRGEPFSTWAGPVSVAFGAEYREDRAESEVDSIAQASGYAFGNPQPYFGKSSVKEGYAEVVVPLAKDMPGLQSLEFNGAIRYTDYEISGGVTTWKAGLTWEPFDGLRLRGTRSRDIRAPNSAELFAVTSSQSTLRNPFSGQSRSITTIFAPSGSLAPEKADTLTLGAVFTPSMIPGLSLSVDFYDIKIDGAIASYPAQQILDNCFAEINSGGAGAFCDSVSRSGTGPSTEINSVTVELLNLASLKTSGVDFEAAYSFDGLGGRLQTRFYGSYVAELISDDGLGNAPSYNGAGVIQSRGSIIDRAGQVGGFTSGLNTGATSVPHWQLNASLGYSNDKWATSLNARWIDGGIVDATLVQPGDPDYNAASPISVGDMNVASRFYLNWMGSVNLIDNGKSKVQLYAVVNNLLNVEPPFPATQLAGFYDRIGRSYKVGVRFDF